MGTSSARGGPTGRRWRLAKGAATRYLSPANDGAVAAREVAARYVAALSEGGGPGLAGPLTVFRQTRKTAQNLGAFWSQAASQGRPAALNAWGLTEPVGAEPETLAPSLSAVLGAAGGGLEQAVAHAALVGTLRPALDLSESAPEASRLVGRFLAAAFHLRLALDLGESLEAAAPGFSPWRQGVRDLAATVLQAAEAARLQAPAPLSPQHWLGLPGWTWVTTIMAGLMSELTGAER